MKKSTVIVLVILFFTVSEGSDLGISGITLKYLQQVYFNNFTEVSTETPEELPVLNENSRVHGMSLTGKISDNIEVGLYGKGALRDATNSGGYTNWGGGLAAFFSQYRFDAPRIFSIAPGLALGCGRFNYSSSNNSGTQAISRFEDAIYIEPMLSGSITLGGKFHISLESSYLLPITGNDYTTGNTSLPSPFPKGFFLGGSIGYCFPKLNKRN